MEDSSLDWENLDYSPDSLKDEGETEKSSGFGWILSRGLNLGKNLAITGIVVSSLPIVVPPLLVVSALGFAFSVPFGFMYASYTCTEKLMSKLLPPSPPHMIDYESEAVLSIEEEEKGNETDQLDDTIDSFSEGIKNYPEELANDNDEVILVQDSEEGLSTVTDLGKDDEGLQKDDINRRDTASHATMVAVDDSAALDAPNKEDMQYDGIDNTHISVEEIGVEPVEVNRSGIEESHGNKATDDTMLQIQTISFRDEINDDKSKKEVVIQRDLEDKIDTKLEDDKNDVHGLKGTDKGKKRHTNAKGKNKTLKTQKRVQGDVSKAQEKDPTKPEMISVKDNVTFESEDKLNLDGNAMQLPAQDVAQEKITGAVLNTKYDTESGNLSIPIEDIEESNKNTGLLASETTSNEPHEQASNVSVLVPVVEVSDSVPVLKQHEELPALKDNDGVHVEGNGLLRNEEMLGDEEIWKQIDSIRMIVGFKVARHTSYFEELKALYVLTGIEPPSLFKDPFDTAEVCDKLRFLMSVIGVK